MDIRIKATPLPTRYRCTASAGCERGIHFRAAFGRSEALNLN
jgi:hypothetical protein